MINFKVFPAYLNSENQKVPLIKGWNEQATDDLNKIRAWQQQFGNKIQFWGVPTGAVNGIFVLDIDVKKVNGWDSLRKLGFHLPETLVQTTPSGGAHYIFKAKPGVHYPNSVNSETGLDTRGDRGWIAWYGRTNQKEIVDAPDWLLSLNVRSLETQSKNVSTAALRLAPEIAHAIFKSSLDSILQAPAGESNNVLNVEAFKVGQLVASGAIPREVAEVELFNAAKLRGKPDYESKATIKSGLDGGVKNPLTSPFPNVAPIAAFPIPEAPRPPERWTPRRLTRSDLLNTSKLKKPQLFQDWSAEDITITTADGGTGKTTLKLNEAISLALGDRFLGFECKQRGRTLFITGEDTEEKLMAMIGAITKQMGLMDGSPVSEDKLKIIEESIFIKKDPDLCLIQKDKHQFLHPNSEAMRKLKEAVDDVKPKLIVFDPISSFWGSETMLNDMNKAVTKFMSWLVEYSGAQVEMINHMGKSSSQNKDMTQFAGRGGSGLPSNSRISRVLRGLTPEEYTELTGGELVGDQVAIQCNVNKFSDGSVLFNKPFIIIRNGYLFSKMTLTEQKAREVEKQMSDTERVFTYVREQRNQGRYPTKAVVIGHFMNNGSLISKAAIERSLSLLEYQGYMGEKIVQIANPNVEIKDRAYIITDLEGREL